MQGNNYYDERAILRKDIRRSANFIGGAFLIGEGIVYLITNILVFALVIVGKTEILSNDVYLWVNQIILSAIILTIPFVIMASPLKVNIASFFDFSKTKKEYLLPLILIGLGVCMVANYLGSMFSSIFSLLGIESAEPEFASEITKGWYFPIISILGGAMLPALVEEFALRGVVLNALRKHGDLFAIIVSALLFGLMHGNLQQLPFAFILGLYFGFITIKTGSVWAAVLLHFVNNTFAFGFDIVGDIIGSGTKILFNAGYFFIMMGLSFVGVALAKKVELFTLPLNNEGGKLTLFQKITTVLSAPAIAIYIGYVIINILLQGLVL